MLKALALYDQIEALEATRLMDVQHPEVDGFRALWDDPQARARLLIYRRAVRHGFYSDTES